MSTSHVRGGPAEHRRTRGRGFSCAACAAAGILLFAALRAFAQDVTEPALKAAFVYNFAKFTDWPKDAVPAKAPFTICVLGDAAVADAVARLSKDRDVAGRPIAVSRLGTDGAPQGCQVLYLSKIPAAQATAALKAVREAPVLTLSDSDHFLERGGIAELYFEHGQLRFDVDLESAKRAQLKISSRLLALARKR